MTDAPPGAPRPPGDARDEEAIAFAHRLLDLARDGDLTLLDYIDRGVPVELTGSGGDTLLMLAASHGHPALVRGLLEQGADPDRANDGGRTPVAAAVSTQAVEVVEVLVAAGADVEAGEPSAIDTARSSELAEIARLLVSRGR